MEVKDNNRHSTDFLNFGTFKAEEGEILKRELEKAGIPIKVIYPGTEVGRESTANVYFPAYTFLIQISDFKTAEKICKKFNIFPLADKEKMPLPKFYTRTVKNKYFSKYFFVGIILCVIAILFDEQLIKIFKISDETFVLILTVALTICFLGWFFTMIYQVLSKKTKKEKIKG